MEDSTVFIPSQLVNASVTVVVWPSGSILVTVLTSVVMMGDEKVDTMVVGSTTVSVVEVMVPSVRLSDELTAGTFELLDVEDVYEPSKLDVMVTVVVFPLEKLLGFAESVIRPTREAPVPVPVTEVAVVRDVSIGVPNVPVALVVKPCGPS
jgi:hypothetical protein